MSLEDTIQSTLNTVDAELETLVQSTQSCIDLPVDTGAVLIYAKCMFIARACLHHYLRRTHNVLHLHMRSNTIDESTYEFSDYHFEFTAKEEYLSFIKQTVANRPINGRPFMFFVMDVQAATKAQQQGLKKLLDTSLNNSVFVLATTSLSHVDHGIRSRCAHINVYKVNHPFFDTPETTVDKYIHKFLATAGKAKQYDQIMSCRDLAYKLFHMNYSLARICKSIIDFFATDDSLVHDVVELCAQCEKQSNCIHKSVLLYERVLIETVMLHLPRFKIQHIKKTTKHNQSTRIAQSLGDAMTTLSVSEVSMQKEQTLASTTPETTLQKRKIVIKRKVQ